LGALGAAICAGVATGVFASFKEASASMVDVMYTAKPDPAKKAIYDKKYVRYRKVIDALDGVWDDWDV
jgi:L-xylulokinase